MNNLLKEFLIFLSVWNSVLSLDLEKFKHCRFLCKDFLETKFHSNVCNAARNIFPKPSVYQACIRGKNVGFEHACMSNCIGDANETNSSLLTCEKYSKKPIPNHQFPWCRRGYDSTFTKVRESIKDILLPSLGEEDEYQTSKNKESKEENENSDLVSNHATSVDDTESYNEHDKLVNANFSLNEVKKDPEIDDIQYRLINDESRQLLEKDDHPMHVENIIHSDNNDGGMGAIKTIHEETTYTASMSIKEQQDAEPHFLSLLDEHQNGEDNENYQHLIKVHREKQAPISGDYLEDFTERQEHRDTIEYSEIIMEDHIETDLEVEPTHNEDEIQQSTGSHEF